MARLQAKPAAHQSSTAHPAITGRRAGKKDSHPRLGAFKMQQRWTASPPATVSESAAAPAVRTNENIKEKAAEGGQPAPVPHACLNTRPGREAVAFQRQEFVSRRAQAIVSKSAAEPAVRSDDQDKEKAPEEAQQASGPRRGTYSHSGRETSVLRSQDLANWRPGPGAPAFQWQDFVNRRAAAVSQSAAAPASGTYQFDFQRLRTAPSKASPAEPEQAGFDGGQETEQGTEKAEPYNVGRRSTSLELGSEGSRCGSQKSTGVLQQDVVEEEDKESSVESDEVDLLVA